MEPILVKYLKGEVEKPEGINTEEYLKQLQEDLNNLQSIKKNYDKSKNKDNDGVLISTRLYTIIPSLRDKIDSVEEEIKENKKIQATRKDVGDTEGGKKSRKTKKSKKCKRRKTNRRRR